MNRRHFLSTAGSALGLTALAPGLAQAVGTPAPKVLEARAATAPLMGDAAPPAAVWGYDGKVPGPIIRSKQGEELHLRFDNKLEQPSTVHWHGIRIDNAMDGVAGLTQAAVPPGESFDYVFTPPDAGTFWYHPHNRTWEQMARGLYGLLIVEETEAPAVDRDLALAFDDWRLGEDGQIDEASLGHLRDWSHAGRLGNWLTVNGVSRPEIPLRKGERLRLRLANCCNARVLSLRLDGHAAMAGRARRSAHRPLSAGRRRHHPGPGPTGRPDRRRRAGARRPPSDPRGQRRIRARGRLPRLPVGAGPARGAPAAARRPARQPPAEGARPWWRPAPGAADGRWRHGAHGRRPSQGPAHGDARTGRPGHGLGLQRYGGHDRDAAAARRAGPHGGDRDDQRHRLAPCLAPARPSLRGCRTQRRPAERTAWRDTVLLQRDEKASIAFPADNPGKWMLHCHMLEHQAAGMATWIEVVG